VSKSARLGPLGFTSDGELVSAMIGVRGSWEQEADKAADARYKIHEDRRSMVVGARHPRLVAKRSLQGASGSCWRLYSPNWVDTSQ
jgi:hypothetical protein